MEIVINLDDEIYEVLKNGGVMPRMVSGMRSGKTFASKLCVALVNSVPLPKGHGNLKDELDLDLSAPSLGTDVYIDDLMAKHDIDYANGDDEDKVRAFALDLIDSCMNVIETAPTIIEADKEE